MTSKPYIFDEFFASGRDESISPFLTPRSRVLSHNLSLKTALASAVFLASSFIASFFLPPLSYLLVLFVYFFSGIPALIASVRDLKNLDINIDTLMTMAAFLSLLIGSSMEGALLLVLFEISGSMEEMVSQKTKNTLISLNRLSPRFACVLSQEGVSFEKALREIDVGTLILVKAGEVVPLDGVVIRGSSFVNLVHLTGESAPVPKKEADEVPAGAYNLDGALVIQVTRTNRDSTLTRIITLITEAQEAKPTLQRFLDRFGKGYATAIISLFFVFAATLPLFSSLPYFGIEGSIYRALSFLIAASPCALIIATPTAYLSAINSCARKGILLKGGLILDALMSCKAVAFDKTGTLTTGKLFCVSLEALNPSPCDEKTALSVAYALEHNAVHPIAEAIISFAKQKQLSPFPLEDFKSIPGYGLEGKISLDGEKVAVAIGHAGFIKTTLPFQKEGHISTLLRVGEALFLFHFTDAVRPEAAQLIATLRDRQHLHALMLTGDHEDMAHSVAKMVGIDEVHASLRPEDKLATVSTLAKTEGLVMIGDGINDAPALARATVGISFGKLASATATEASDIVFLHDDLMLVDWVLDKARRTRRIVKQNISLALGVILFASTPALLGLVPLWVAVVLHEGGTILVGLNSLRLLKR